MRKIEPLGSGGNPTLRVAASALPEMSAGVASVTQRLNTLTPSSASPPVCGATLSNATTALPFASWVVTTRRISLAAGIGAVPPVVHAVDVTADRSRSYRRARGTYHGRATLRQVPRNLGRKRTSHAGRTALSPRLLLRGLRALGKEGRHGCRPGLAYNVGSTAGRARNRE